MNPEISTKTPWCTSTKFIIPAVVVALAIVGVVVFLLMRDDSNSVDSSQSIWTTGSCPDSIQASNGKTAAISQGKEYGLSEEVYEWVQENCKDIASNDTGSSTNGGINPDLPPVLENLGVEFGPYNSATKTAGDFLFTNDALRDHLKGFFEFGALVNTSEKKILPNLEYGSLVEGTKIIAVSGGYVVNVVARPDSKDYTVHVVTNPTSSWEIAYDHIIDPQVKKGDTISAGDTIGQVAQQNNGLFRTELQVQRTINGVTEYYCPFALMDTAVKDGYIEKIKTLQSDWEAFAGRNLYDEDKQFLPGCNYETLTDAKMAELVK